MGKKRTTSTSGGRHAYDREALGNWSVTESNAAETPIWTAAFLRAGSRVSDWDFEFVGEGRNAFRIEYDGEWFVFSRSP